MKSIDYVIESKFNCRFQKFIFSNVFIIKFSTKNQAIEYAKKNNILYTVIEPKKKEFVIKSYADNFLKN